jgi:hypothetical protein
MSGKVDKCPLCDKPADFNVGYILDRDTDVYGGQFAPQPCQCPAHNQKLGRTADAMA